MSEQNKSEEYRQRMAGSFVLHPKVAYQGLVATDEDRKRLASAVPNLVPFKDHEYHAFIPVVDWDHRIPSNQLILRIYCYYSEESYRYGQADLDVRLREIQARDLFPEFDVPDLAGVVADEAYDVIVDRAGARKSVRFASSWRRDLNPTEASKAASIVRSSPQFATIKERYKNRPPNLGDAEAVSWTPPCESNHARWTIDVWYLVSYDGMFGRGRSFLVDLETESIVAVREFTVRPD